MDHLCRRNRHLLALSLSLSLSLSQSSISSLKPILYTTTTTTRTNAYSLVFRRRWKQLPNGLLPCRDQQGAYLGTAASIVKRTARNSCKRATKGRCNSFRSREQEKGKTWPEWPSTHFFFLFYFSHLNRFFFFPAFSSFYIYFFGDSFFFNHVFFWLHPWPQFFLGTSYLPPPLPPTYHPSSYQPTYLPPFLLPTHLPPSCHWPPSPLTSISRPPKPGRVSAALSFDLGFRHFPLTSIDRAQEPRRASVALSFDQGSNAFHSPPLLELKN